MDHFHLRPKALSNSVNNIIYPFDNLVWAFLVLLELWALAAKSSWIIEPYEVAYDEPSRISPDVVARFHAI